MKKNSPQCVVKGFTLVEVTLAMGVISFSLLALVGLLPQGLLMVKNANDRSAAAGALGSLTDAIRHANFDGIDGYHATTYPDLTWQVGSPDGQVGSPDRVDFSQLLNHAGLPIPINDASEHPRMVARVELVPPSDPIAIGRARVSIAWPATATWDATSGAWRNAEGFITQGIAFVPKS